DVLHRLLTGIDDLVETVTRWFITRRGTDPITDQIEAYGPGFGEIARGIRTMGPKQWQNRLERRVERLVDRDVPEAIAVDHAFQTELVHAPDIIDVAAETGLPLRDVGQAFFRAGQVFHIDWLERQIESLPTATRWQRWATLSLEQELMNLRRVVVERVLADDREGDVNAAFVAFSESTAIERERLGRLVSLLRKDGVSDTAAVVVALRQIMTLAGGR
ncbi:MAG: NAD-glutamate dehydrogenase, partial [Actinomycetota bacterium]|nr:NAD-glutamate dehydrogenase [Actinomycetota bacterium]